MAGWLDWLIADPEKLTDWTPQRAAQAERNTLLAAGHVIEPSYLWSQPAKAREQQARLNREQSWRKAFSTRVGNVAEFKQNHRV